MPKPIETLYRRDGNVFLIELDLRDPRQLFNNLDPAPFRDKDLESAAEYYIVEAVRELGPRRNARLVVHLPAAAAETPDAQSIPDAVHNYFAYCVERAGNELRALLQAGLVSLGIGLTFLALCLTIRELIGGAAAQGPARYVLQEGLLIMGWVAMWRPVQILLYEWWPIARRRTLFRAIERMPIEVRPR